MKKIITILLLTCSVMTIHAQKSKREEGIKLGIKGGLNVTSLMGDVEELSIRTSVHLGFLAEIIVSDNFSIQPELLYSGQGATVDATGGGRIKLNYVTLPVLAKFPVVKGLSLEAGPQVGFLTSAKLKVKVVGFGSDTQGANQLFKEIDFGFNLGAGYNISKNAMVNVRYNLGLSNIAETESGDTTTINNRVFSLSVGYIF